MMELFAAVFAAGLAIGYALRGRADRDDRDEIDAFLDEREQELRERYQTTEMDYVTFAERIAPIEDPHTERIMRDAVDVDGIGPATAFRLACRFDGWEDYRSATSEEYQQVNRIGEQKGRSLAARH